MGTSGLLKVGGLFLLSGLIRVQVGGPQAPASKAEAFGIALEGCQSAFASGKPEKCKLFGKIQFVTSSPDVRVEIVDAFADIRVEKVSAFADSAGKWEIVEHFPDFKVEIVSAFADYKVEYVESFPGCN